MNAEEMQRKMVDYEQKIKEHDRKMVDYEQKIVDYEKKIKEHDRKMVDYEQKINEHDRKMVRYERKIERLQDDLSHRDNEIRRAKFTVVQALPELNAPDLPYVISRIPGYLDKTIFDRACLAWVRKQKDDETTSVRAEAESVQLFMQWKANLANVRWNLRIEGPGEGEGGRVQIENPSILEVKEKYGEELYNAIKKAWMEIQELRRTGVMLKPWNFAAGREQTLTELLAPLGATIQVLRG